ncbi:sarcoplasmic calcium-binding protein-like [Mercenaria mercenaria]|uniref:sarcoplasmic calcium-binding protein-like n=1 Tax=Mercenaria mercenaria TaxID=6596 RepID=UPI00234EFAA6|nr:sarcoplasmic calcium-binding protein-like [Mercenaria mercenaria]
MANDYLVSKWKKWFGLFDNNKDGKVCYADMELARDKFLKLHHLEGEDKKNANDKFTKWWCKYVMWEKPEITVEEFVECQNTAFKADKDKFVERIKTCQDEIGDFVGTAHDGFISEKEIVIIFKAEGHDDEALDKKFFAHFSPVGGKVPLNTMIGYWIHFLTSEDISLPDPVQRAFEDGI